MALEYHTNLKFDRLAPVLEDYADWFAHISLAVAYMDEDTKADKIHAPKSFNRWLEETRGEEGFNQDLISEILYVYEDMITKGDDIAGTLQSDTKPHFEDFEEFKNLYSGFLTKLRRLEKDSAFESHGLDEETGFRTKDAILTDQKKEMERLRRQGTAFCLVMVRVDDLVKHNKEAAMPVIVKSIRDCVRAFDDAYYLEEGHFLLSLKQTDMIGAEAAADRLQLIIHQAPDYEEEISFSFCMAEPVENDEVMELIDNMRKDLDNHRGEEGAFLRFVELSPLQRYLNTMK